MNTMIKNFKRIDPQLNYTDIQIYYNWVNSGFAQAKPSVFPSLYSLRATLYARQPPDVFQRSRDVSGMKKGKGRGHERARIEPETCVYTVKEAANAVLLRFSTLFGRKATMAWRTWRD